MYKFSKKSLNNLSTCHIDLQLLFKEVIKYIDCSVLEGHRGKELQDKYFNKGTSKCVWPNSKHNKSPSMAVDVVPYPIDWKDTKRFFYFGGEVIMCAKMLKAQKVISHSVRWGRDWDMDDEFNDQKLNDCPHFELVEDR